MFLQGIVDGIHGLDAGRLDTGSHCDLRCTVDLTDGIGMVYIPAVCRSGQERDATIGGIHIIHAVLPDPVHSVDRYDSGKHIGRIVGGRSNGIVAVGAIFLDSQGNHGVARRQVRSLPAIAIHGNCLEVVQNTDFLSVLGIDHMQSSFVSDRCRTAAVTTDRRLIAGTDTGCIDYQHRIVGKCRSIGLHTD